MRRKSFWVLGLVACLGLAIAGFAEKGPKKRPGGNVSMDGTFRELAEDGIKGDEFGPTYVDGEPGVKVVIRSNGLFNLNINAGRKNAGKSMRDLTLDISNCLEGAVPDGCVTFAGLEVPETSEVDDFVSLRVFDTPDENGVIQNLSTLQNIGDSAALNAALLFSTAGDNWALDFRPHPEPESLCGSFGSDSGPVLVTRTASDTWVIEAIVGTNPTTTDRACLISGLRMTGNIPTKFRGTYVMPFRLTATRR